MEISRNIDQQLYPRKALADTRQAYRDFCDCSVTPLGSNQAKLLITVKPEYKTKGHEVVLEFLNYLLDRASQIHLEQK